MLRDILLSAIIFILFLILLFFLISGYTDLVQKREQHNKSYEMQDIRNKSPLIPKVEVFKAPEKVNQLLMARNITNVHVMTEEEFEKEMQRYSDIREKAHSYINSLR